VRFSTQNPLAMAWLGRGVAVVLRRWIDRTCRVMLRFCSPSTAMASSVGAAGTLRERNLDAGRCLRGEGQSSLPIERLGVSGSVAAVNNQFGVGHQPERSVWREATPTGHDFSFAPLAPFTPRFLNPLRPFGEGRALVEIPPRSGKASEPVRKRLGRPCWLLPVEEGQGGFLVEPLSCQIAVGPFHRAGEGGGCCCWWEIQRERNELIKIAALLGMQGGKTRGRLRRSQRNPAHPPCDKPI